MVIDELIIMDQSKYTKHFPYADLHECYRKQFFTDAVLIASLDGTRYVQNLIPWFDRCVGVVRMAAMGNATKNFIMFYTLHTILYEYSITSNTNRSGISQLL